jgi:hypothetical protein
MAEQIQGLPPGAVAEPIQGLPPGATVEPVQEEGFASRAKRFLTTPLKGETDVEKGERADIAKPPTEFDINHPYAGAGVRFLKGSDADATKELREMFTSPLGILLLATGGLGKLPGAIGTVAKGFQIGTGAGFGVEGLSKMLGGEDLSDRLSGGGQALLGFAGATEPVANSSLVREIKAGPSATDVMLHDRAMEVQGHIQQIQRNLHHVANEAYQGVVKAVDQANPDGVAPQSSVRNILLRNLSEYNHLDLPLPKTLRDVMAEPEGPLTNEPMASFQWLSDVQKLIGQNMKRDDLSQPIQQALVKSYGQVAGLMRRSAEAVDPELGQKFSDANGLYKQYYTDFASGTPFGKILAGQNAQQILGELNGPDRELVRRQIGSYKEYGADPRGIANDAKAYKLSKIKNIVAKSSERLASGFVPGADILIGGPLDRISKTPSVINWRAGQGPAAVPDMGTATPWYPTGSHSKIMNFSPMQAALPSGQYEAPPSGMQSFADNMVNDLATRSKLDAYFNSRQLGPGQYESGSSDLAAFAERLLQGLQKANPPQLPAGQYEMPASPVPPIASAGGRYVDGGMNQMMIELAQKLQQARQ